MPTFTPADMARHRDVLQQLNVEFMAWNAVEIERIYGLTFETVTGNPVEAYVARVLDQVCGDPPPRGSFYLVEQDDEIVGMGGLRRLDARTCELKRVYVRPAFRGQGVGAAIVRRVVHDARAFGFTAMQLDSGPYMTAAHRVYAAMGFVDCAPYAGAEVPRVLHHGWRFMRLDLAQHGSPVAMAPTRDEVTQGSGPREQQR